MGKKAANYSKQVGSGAGKNNRPEERVGHEREKAKNPSIRRGEIIRNELQ